MDEMSAQRLAQLRQALEQAPGELEPILAAFVEPALALAQDRNGGGAFIRVIARAYAEKNDGLRKFLSERYGHVLRDFARAKIGRAHVCTTITNAHHGCRLLHEQKK